MTKRKTLPIKHQIRITDRVRCDLMKESRRHRDAGNDMAASDCETQATALYDVIETLKITAQMSDVLSKVIPIANDQGARATISACHSSRLKNALDIRLDDR